MIPSSSSADAGARGLIRLLAVGLLVAGPLACQPTGATSFPTQSQHDDDERRAAGIAVDLASPPPPSRDRADSGDPIVALRAPLGLAAAHETIRHFFDAVYAEDIAAMSELLAPEAQVQDTRSGPNAKAHPATTLWRQRFQKRDYPALSGQLVYRDIDVGTYRGDQLDALPLAVRYLSANDEVRANDLVLHVPIITHSLRSERFFGDEIFFWLQRRGSRYVIYRMAERVPF